MWAYAQTAIKLVIFLTSLILLKLANKQLIESSSGEHKNASNPSTAAVRIGLFVQVLLCVVSCGDTIVSEVERHHYHDTDVTALDRSRDEQMLRSHSEKVVREFQVAWWWSHHAYWLQSRQLYHSHTQRIQSSLFMLFQDPQRRAGEGEAGLPEQTESANDFDSTN